MLFRCGAGAQASSIDCSICWPALAKGMTQKARLTISETVAGSYSFLRGAVMPALSGSLVYAVASVLSDIIREHQIFGSFSFVASFVLLASMGILWLAMALRAGLGKARKGFLGLHIGREEAALGASIAGFAFVTGLIIFLVGFFVFLFIMSISVIGEGGLSGADAASAEILKTPEAFAEFLTGTSGGQAVAVISALTLFGAGVFLFWFVARLLPFAGAAVDQKRFVVLQAMAWTRYQDKVLMGAGVLTIGVAALVIVVGRMTLGALSLPLLPSELLKHLLSCFAALLVVGYICEVYRGLVPMPLPTGEPVTS